MTSDPDAVGWRLFLALPLPPEATAALVERLAPYRSRFGQARWLPVESLHLTLLFLGSVAPREADVLAAILDAEARSQPPIALATGTGGGRARGGDGVAWLSLPVGGVAVTRLAERIAVRLPPGLLGGDRTPRRSHAAHLTVARRADEALIGALGEQRHGPLAVAWTAERAVLFRSFLERKGARYEALYVARLEGSR